MTEKTEYVIQYLISHRDLYYASKNGPAGEGRLRASRRLQAHQQLNERLPGCGWPNFTVTETWHDHRESDRAFPNEPPEPGRDALTLELRIYVEDNWEERFEKP